MPQFTTQVPIIAQFGPVVECHFGVSPQQEAALKKAGKQIPALEKVAALVDTGATGSGIETGLAAKLNIPPTGTQLISSASHQNQQCLTYAGRLVLPDSVVVNCVQLIEFPISLGPCQFLIGRDILSKATLVYIGHMNQFTLAF